MENYANNSFYEYFQKHTETQSMKHMKFKQCYHKLSSIKEPQICLYVQCLYEEICHVISM